MRHTYKHGWMQIDVRQAAVGPSVRVAVALAQEVCRLTWPVRGVVGVWWWVPVVAAVVVVARLIVRLIVMRLMIVRVWVAVVLQQ